MFWCSVVLIMLVTAVALFPGLFAQAAPNNDCLLADSNGGPAPGHPSGSPSRAAISIRASSTARARRCRSA
ncbi:hypothetical protein ACRAWC_20125 [Leifsonia sp. L25]|uniref:hypothetical protein n=1 Tax=Leifsonia sp. L25 TaxID=3423957 RepID=UPI003D69F465